MESDLKEGSLHTLTAGEDKVQTRSIERETEGRCDAYTRLQLKDDKMFDQQKKDLLKVGDLITVGSNIDGKFTAIRPHLAKVERIWKDTTTASIQIDLCWGELGKSKVYMHDLNKTWMKASNFN